MGTFSSLEQRILFASRVCIVGLGGLGGAVTEILASPGIGDLTLIDGDGFEESNLNRQLLRTVQNLGKSKATTAWTVSKPALSWKKPPRPPSAPFPTPPWPWLRCSVRKLRKFF